MKLLITMIISLLTLANSHHESWRRMLAVPDMWPIKFRLVLPQMNVNILLEYLDHVSDIESLMYGAYLSNSFVSALVSPDPTTRAYLMGWADASGFTCIDGGDYMSCAGSALNVYRAFGTKMYLYGDNFGNLKLRSDTSYHIPNSLQDRVEWVSGLSNHLFPLRTTKRTNSIVFVNNSDYPADTGFVSREVVQRMYSLGDATVTHNSSVAAAEFQEGGYTQSDLDQTLVFNNLPKKNVTCNNGTNMGSDVETMLDMDMLADIAGNAELCFLNYDSWIYEFATDLQNMTGRPDVVSVSYGWSERDQCSIVVCDSETSKQYVDRSNVELAKLAAMGVTVVVSSGDAGAPGRTCELCDGANALNPIFPGSSPYVVSVGATYVVASNTSQNWTTPLCTEFGCANGTTTKVVNYNDTGWTSGSGFTLYPATRPDWQNSAVNEYLNSGVYLPVNSSSWNRDGRGYPDVVALGHNCAVYNVDGTDTFSGVDGTSCSAPLVAAMFTLMNDHQVANGRPKLGYVNPLLYRLASGYSSPFSRPSGGNTYCTEYTCCSQEYGFQSPPNKTVWDPVTGLGELNVQKMIGQLDSYFNLCYYRF
jgi:tripeptidyl-peptidase-1